MFRKSEISSYRLPIALLVMAIFSQYLPSAYADIIKVSFSGTVLDSSGYSFTGDGDLTNGTVGTGFFGEQASGGTFDNPNVADINGALISGEYIIDTTLAPDNTSGFEFLGDYRSRRDVNDWMMASAIINGVAVDTFRPQIFNDSSSSLHFNDAIPVFNFGFDKISLSDFVNTRVEENGVRTVQNIFINLSLEEFVQDVFFSGVNGDIPTAFFEPWTDNDPTDSAIGTYGFIHTVVELTSPFGVTKFDSQGSFQVTSVRFELLPSASVPEASVPEPATFALLGLGLAGLGFARRWLH